MHPVHKSRSVPLASLVSSPADSPFSGLCSTSISPEKGVYRWCSCLFVSRVNSDSNPLLLASQGETIPSRNIVLTCIVGIPKSWFARDIICKGRQGGRAATTLTLPPADGHLEGHGCHRAMEPISDMGHVAKSWMIWIDMVGKNSLPDLARMFELY